MDKNSEKNNLPVTDGLVNYRIDRVERQIIIQENRYDNLQDRMNEIIEHRKWLETNDDRMANIERTMETTVKELKETVTDSGKSIDAVSENLHDKFNKIIFYILGGIGSLVLALLTILFTIFSSG